MEENKEVIFFTGDSFTWGEGLELYIDSPYWITQRNLTNTWGELRDKQTDESIQFRETHRFANIVSNHFGITPIIHEYNGGQFETPINVIEETLPSLNPNKIKAIFIQFTSINRMLLHLDLKCNCKFCSLTGFEKPFNIYTEFLSKIINNIPLTSLERFGMEYLRDNHGIDFNENMNADDIKWEKIDGVFEKMYRENLHLYIEKYINKWKQIAPVYFLDSWDGYSSNILAEFSDIKNNLIPLKGWDGNYYTNWNEWEDTFPYKRIVTQFPATDNGHPTLVQHKYIAESIIEILK